MASSIVFLAAACYLLPLLAAWKDTPDCVFPFWYKDRYYTACTRAGDEHGQLWCATTDNYDRDGEGKSCSTQEYGGNSNGNPCVFPFSYLGKIYYTCTTKFSDKPWCATTGSYDKNRKWSYCSDLRQVGEPCYFPFIYQNRSHTTCISEGSADGEPWCSVTENYDLNGRRISCKDSDPRPCYFPFKYEDRFYCSCTRKGTTDDHLWCSTTPDYDEDSQWKSCFLQEYGGNSHGEPCHFPFFYKEEIYHNCTSEDEPTGRLWCSTTSSFDNNGKWAFCADGVLPNNTTCVFPFTYKGVSYSSCTKKGSWRKKFWCSLTSNYDVNHMWKYCDSTGVESGCSDQS
ncbi:epididymal sperm-binding protein 1-like [Eublepharis macularius]|uniref:Epididymal sperm-binding protein 1-like n=2 Tax=Eublepharis macularius TaxID=481883 RepID=A0AA97K0D2_EUBMA|nr:epididymal sperm-binding protein 1-like [Eublepharis macularius]